MAPPKFVDAHSPEWINQAMALTMDYFEWMNQEIIKTCQFSIADIVEMPLATYVTTIFKTICPDNPDQGVFYLLVIDGVAVGMGGLRRLPGGQAEIVRIYTQPMHRGKGYGGMVLARLIDDAKHLDCRLLNLDTGIFMNSAYALYESYGFKDCEPYEGAEPPAALFPYWRFMQLPLRDSTDCSS